MMKALTVPECQEWCRGRGLILEDNGRISFRDDGCVTDSPVPRDVRKQEYWLRTFLSLTPADSAHLIWLTSWNEFSLDRGLMILLEKFRKACGEVRPLSEAPGFLFDASERETAMGLLRFTLAFDWDVFCLPADPGAVFFEFHDEYVHVVAPDKKRLEAVQAQLSTAGGFESFWNK